jgi:hypothetical protein
LDAYSVSTTLALNDQLIAGLRRVAQQLRLVDTDFNRLQQRVNRFRLPAGLIGELGALRTGLGATAMGARQAQSALGAMRVNPAAAAGAQSLGRSLGSAATQATRLSRALTAIPNAGGRGPGGRPPGPPVLPPGMGPWGPRQPPALGRGGGSHGGAWGSGIFNRGALHTAYDAMLIGHAVSSFLHPSIEFGHERYLAEVIGENAAQRERMQQAAFGTARAVPNKSAVELMRLQRELLPIALGGLQPGQGPDEALAKVIEHLPEAARMDTLLASYLGEKAGDHKQRASQFYQALRAGEILGLRGEALSGFVDQAAKAMVIGGGRLNMEQFRQFAAISGAAGVVMDPQLLLRYMPELMTEIGGARLGTMTATFMQSGAGRMTRRALEANISAGLIDPSKVELERGRIKRLQPGAFDTRFGPDSEFLRFHNPARYALEVLGPALRAQGIDPNSTDPHQRVAMIRQLAYLFSDRKAQQFMEMLLLHSRQMENFSKRVDKVRLDYDQARRVDPKLALEALGGAWTTLRAAIGDTGLITPGAGLVTDMMTGLAGLIRAHPQAAGVTEMGIAGGLGLLGVGAAIRGVQFGLSGLAAIPGLATLGGALARIAGGLGLLATIGTTLFARLGEAPSQTAEWLRSFSSSGTPLRELTERFIAQAMERPVSVGGRLSSQLFARRPEAFDPAAGIEIGDVDLLRRVEGIRSRLFSAAVVPATLPTPRYMAEPANGMIAGGALWRAAAGVETRETVGSVSLTGQTVLTGELHIDGAGFEGVIGRFVARGLANATGTGLTTGGAHPNWQGGITLPPPT